MKKFITSITSLLLSFSNIYSQTITRDTIYFDFNRSELRTGSEQSLSELAEKLIKAEDYKITILGHTDNWGNENYNLNLSEKRAQTVRNYLIKNGFSESKMTWQSFGESNPAVLNLNIRNRQLNRRVEITCISQPKIVIKKIIQDSTIKKNS